MPSWLKWKVQVSQREGDRVEASFSNEGEKEIYTKFYTAKET